MKHDHHSQPQSELMNGENQYANSVKEKRKTVHIKLHPKPYAPRHSGFMFQSPKLYPQ